MVQGALICKLYLVLLMQYIQETPKACRNLITLAMEGLSVSCSAHEQLFILSLQDIMTTLYSTGSISSRHSPMSQSWQTLSVVPGFLVQTGDKTGTGTGGASIYEGEPSAHKGTRTTYARPENLSRMRSTLDYVLHIEGWLDWPKMEREIPTILNFL